MGISGPEFEEAWERRAATNVDGLLVPFISREDLIAAKLASGRPQDLVDAQSISDTGEK